MSKYKVGDRVKCVRGYCTQPPKTGWTGTVYEVVDDHPIFRAKWDQNPCATEYGNVCRDDRAELIQQPKAMPTTNNDHIEQQLLAILNGHVSTVDYLNAENKARKVEKEEGRLTDLRACRDGALDALRDFAGEIARLQREVNDINNR